MGVTIHHRLGQKKKYVKSTLDHAQDLALNIANAQAGIVDTKIQVRRESDMCLLVDIGNCETLSFDFKSVAEIEKAGAEGWNYEYATLTDDGKKKLDAGYEIEQYPENEMVYASSFCKTQFANKLVEHKWVADIIRAVASRCFFVEVTDEGDYYHSGKIDDASEAIEENGAMIADITGQLNANGFDGVSGGETKITNRKKKNNA